MGARRILVVEDEMMVVMYLEDVLESLGHTVAATAGRLDVAVELARSADVDFALLDLNLGGARTFPVAEVLKSRGIAFAFATGYGAGGVPAEFADAPLVSKPFRMEEIEALFAA